MAAEAWELLFELFMAQKPRFPAIAAEFDLTPSQMHVLHLLGQGGPMPMHTLAASLACDASNVTGIVDRLEGRGLVERRSDAQDRRVKILGLTDEGLDLRERLRDLIFAPPPPIARLSAADQRALRDILRRALASR